MLNLSQGIIPTSHAGENIWCGFGVMADAAGPKISIFLTLPIVTRGAYSSPSQGSRGKRWKRGKIFHFYNGMEMLLLRFRGFRFNT